MAALLAYEDMLFTDVVVYFALCREIHVSDRVWNPVKNGAVPETHPTATRGDSKSDSGQFISTRRVCSWSEVKKWLQVAENLAKWVCNDSGVSLRRFQQGLSGLHSP